MGNGALAIGPKLPRPSSTLPGCVKTRLGEGCAELFSQLPSTERSCQYNRLPYRRNRDGSSTRKLDIGVFTQTHPITDSSPTSRRVRKVPWNEPAHAGGAGGAVGGSRLSQ